MAWSWYVFVYDISITLLILCFLQVNTNGLLSFGNAVTMWNISAFPIDGTPLVAPFWADVDARRNGGRVYYRVVTDQSSPIVTKATKDVKDIFVDQPTFQANFVFIATWYRVTYFGSTRGSSAPVWHSFVLRGGPLDIYRRSGRKNNILAPTHNK